MEIRLTWKGTEYLIPESRIFAAADAVEEIVSLAETYRWLKEPRFTKMAKCMAALLKVAGMTGADPEVVWREITAHYRRAQASEVLGAILTLQAALMNGAPEAAGQDAAPGKASAS